VNLIVSAAMYDVYEVALKVNELIAGYNYLLSVVQTAEPHAIADLAALRERGNANAMRITGYVDEISSEQLAALIRRRIAKAPAEGTGAGE